MAIEDQFEEENRRSSVNESSEWNSEKVQRLIKADYDKE